MFIKLLAAFIIIPLVEVYLLIQLAQATKISTTFLIVIGTGLLGSWLARREGTMALYRFQEAMNQGRVPSKEIQDGLMIVFAAALLLTPGLLTDLFGFVLLIPPGRALIRRYVLPRLMGGLQIRVGPVSVMTEEDPPEVFHAERRNANDPMTIDSKAVPRN